MGLKLLTTRNYKTLKGESLGYLTGILHLAPAMLSGHNVCPRSTPGCRAACLNTAGHGVFNNTQTARINRTKMMFQDREKFDSLIRWDIEALVREAYRKDLKPVVRLNGTSDMPALALKFAREYPSVQFYDYTKIFETLLRKDIPENYDLTFSRSEANDDEVRKAIDLGFNVAVVFSTPLPDTWWKIPVIQGDDHDLRFLDPPGVIVGLSAKGRGKKDMTSFVQR